MTPKRRETYRQVTRRRREENAKMTQQLHRHDNYTQIMRKIHEHTQT